MRKPCLPKHHLEKCSGDGNHYHCLGDLQSLIIPSQGHAYHLYLTNSCVFFITGNSPFSLPGNPSSPQHPTPKVAFLLTKRMAPRWKMSDSGKICIGQGGGRREKGYVQHGQVRNALTTVSLHGKNWDRKWAKIIFHTQLSVCH